MRRWASPSSRLDPQDEGPGGLSGLLQAESFEFSIRPALIVPTVDHDEIPASEDSSRAERYVV